MKKKKEEPKEVTMEEFLANMSKAMNKETTDGRGDDEDEEKEESQ